MGIPLLGLFHAVAGLVLLVAGALALSARKQERSGHSRLGEAYFWTLTVTLGTGLLVGVAKPGLTLFEIMTPPTWILGLLGYVVAKRRPRGWLRPHIGGQGGSYIGVVTAFSFQLFPRFLPDSLALTTALWVVPTVVGSVLINRAVGRWSGRTTGLGRVVG